jgi:hypothetical protein
MAQSLTDLAASCGALMVWWRWCFRQASGGDAYVNLGLLVLVASALLALFKVTGVWRPHTIFGARC